jgi:hypothetical protein
MHRTLVWPTHIAEARAIQESLRGKINAHDRLGKIWAVAACRKPRVTRIGWLPLFDCRALFFDRGQRSVTLLHAINANTVADGTGECSFKVMHRVFMR